MSKVNFSDEFKQTEDFKQEAVRIALTSGVPRRRVASDLGVGFSTLSKWVSQYRPIDLTAHPQADLARENERLRLENRILKEERDILKKATQFFASQRPGSMALSKSGGIFCQRGCFAA
jgi:transposase